MPEIHQSCPSRGRVQDPAKPSPRGLSAAFGTEHYHLDVMIGRDRHPHTTLFFVRGNKSSENDGNCEHPGSFESSPVVFQMEV
jgi:hypothetical protein